MKSTFALAFLVLGFCVFVSGIWQIHHAAALIVAGACLMAAAFRSSGKQKP